MAGLPWKQADKSRGIDFWVLRNRLWAEKPFLNAWQKHFVALTSEEYPSNSLSLREHAKLCEPHEPTEPRSNASKHRLALYSKLGFAEPASPPPTPVHLHQYALEQHHIQREATRYLLIGSQTLYVLTTTTPPLRSRHPSFSAQAD